MATTSNTFAGFLRRGAHRYLGTSAGQSHDTVKSDAAGFQPQSHRTAVRDPTVTDDIDAGFEAGSYWINTSSKVNFVCVDPTSGAAVWSGTTTPAEVSASSAGLQPQSNRVATSDPTVSDDSDSGYKVGSFWVNTSSGEHFVCVDSTSGAAVWKSTAEGVTTETSSSGSGLQPQSNRSATTDPGVGDDTADGYQVGSYWVNTSTGEQFVCVDDSSGAAVWTSTTASITTETSSSSAGLQPASNRAATVDPTSSDDENDGYKVGSYWVNTSTSKVFFCVHNAAGNAIWLDVTNSSEVNVADSQLLYSAGGAIAGSNLLYFDGGASTLYVPPTVQSATSGGSLAVVAGSSAGSGAGGSVNISGGASGAGTGGSVNISSGLATSGTNGDVSIIAADNVGSINGHVYISSQGVNYRWPAESTASRTFSVMMIQSGGEGSSPVLTFSRDVSLGDGVFAGDLDVGGTLDVSSNAVIESGAVVGASSSDASAVLTVTSTSKGLLPPRMTTSQRENIFSPTDGLVVYDTSMENLFLRQDGSWTALTTSAFDKPQSTLNYNGTFTNTTPQDLSWASKDNVNGGIPWVSGSTVNLQCTKGKAYQVNMTMRPGSSNTHIAFEAQDGNSTYVDHSYLLIEGGDTGGSVFGSTKEKNFVFRADGSTDAENQIKFRFVTNNGATSLRVDGMYVVIREL